MTAPFSSSSPRFGAWPDTGGTRFRVWAPGAHEVWLALEQLGQADDERPLTPKADGVFEGWMPDVGPGARYRYRLDGDPPLPDPASRFQPDGVHGPSEVVDPGVFEWSDDGWPGTTLDRASIYELHVGTFSPEGTFAGVTARLPYLRDLGVTAVELMPVADFPGDRNWGYDGVCLFAPARCYGRPDDLRRLVDTAHRLGLAVFLDVVYNHLGPDGAHMGRFAPAFFSDRHQSPWGQAICLDGPQSAMARAWIIDNAQHWVREYHVDGLRLDATHALVDESDTHLAAELAAHVHEAGGARQPPAVLARSNVHGTATFSQARPGRARRGPRGSDAGRRGPRKRPSRGVGRSPTLVIAEDHRNLAVMVRPATEGGWDLDGVWADDFHHEMRRRLAGDRDGYYADFTGTSDDLARTIRQGWFFTGQHSGYLGKARGTDPAGIPLWRFIVCLQNHDQIGNRAFGERLHHQVDPAAYRAALAVLLTVPETPLLFMGQEWAASSPFQYFTDHNEALGRLVTEGRRREFGRFSTFADPAVRERIPDPQAPSTFDASRLRWAERRSGVHRAAGRLTQALLALRRTEPALAPGTRFTVAAPDADSLVMQFAPDDAHAVSVVARLGAPGTVPLTRPGGGDGPWSIVLSTEDPRFSLEPRPPAFDTAERRPIVRFAGPAALVLRWP